MPDIDALYNEFSGKGKPSSDPNVDALYNEFGGTATPAVASQVSMPAANATIPSAPVNGVVSYQTPEQHQTDLNTSLQPPNRFGNAVADVGINFWKNTKEAFQSGKEMLSSGIQDIGEGRSASGVGKSLLGAVQMSPPGAVYSGAVNTIGDTATKLTGNEDFGSRAALIAGSGLPFGKVASAINAARPTNRAIGAMITAIGTENLPHVIERLKSNPRLSLADVSPAVLQDTQKLVVTEGNHQNTLSQFTKDRISGAKGAVQGAIDDTMGTPVNVVTKLNELKKAAKDTGANLINPAVTNAKAVDISPVLEHIKQKSQKGVNAVITMGEALPDDSTIKRLKDIQAYIYNGKSVSTDPQRLHNFQSSLRTEADSLLNSPNSQDRLKGYQIMQVRNKIVDAIDTASGPIDPTTKIGPYKAGLKAYAKDKDIDEAFHEGTKLLKNTGLEDRPEFLAEWLKGASDLEIAAKKEGARLAVDKQIRGMRNAVGQKGTEIPQVEFNKDKLKLLFGDKEVESMTKRLQDERDISTTNNKLFENAQTAMRLKSNSRIDLPTKKEMGITAGLATLAEIASNATTGIPALGGSSVLAASALHHGAYVGKRKLAMKKNEEYTNLVTATGQARDELIKKLESFLPVPKQSLLQRTGSIASRLPIAAP